MQGYGTHVQKVVSVVQTRGGLPQDREPATRASLRLRNGRSEKEAGGPPSTACLATWNSFLEFGRCGRQQTLRCSYNQKRWAPRSGTYSGAEATPFIAGPRVRGKTSLRPSQTTHHSETCPPGATATSSRACWAFPEDPMRPVGGRVLAGKRDTECAACRGGFPTGLELQVGASLSIDGT